MLLKIFIVIVTVPLIEVFLLLKVGSLFGFWTTFGLVLLTGVIGAKLAHSQGIRVIKNLQVELTLGKMPAETLLDGVCILVAGAVLLTPGFVTDFFGFILLIPQCRNVLKKLIGKQLEQAKNSGQGFASGFSTSESSGEVKSSWRVVPDQDSKIKQ